MKSNKLRKDIISDPVSAILLLVFADSALGMTVELPADVQLTMLGVADFIYDDNIFMDASKPLGGWLGRISPEIELSRDGARSTISASLTATKGVYESNLRENIDDYNAALSGQVQPFDSLGFTFAGRYQDEHQQLSGYLQDGTASAVIEVDRVRTPEFEMGAVFGREESRTQGSYRFGKRVKDYYGDLRDYEQNYQTLDATYAFSERIHVTGELTDSDIRYESTQSQYGLSSTESRYVLGASLRFPKSQIDLRAGGVKKNYDASERDTFTGSLWNLGASWSPKSYSTFKFYAGKSIQESLGVADVIVTQSGSISWSHRWSQALDTSITFGQSHGDFRATEQANKISRGDMSVRYAFRERVTLSVGLTHVESSSGLKGVEFERNQVFFRVAGPL